MRVALQLLTGLHLGVIAVQVAQKAIDLNPVVLDGHRSQGGGHDLKLFLEDSI